MKKLTLLLLSVIFITACAQAEPTVSQQPTAGKIIIPKDPNETYNYSEDEIKYLTSLDASYTDGYDLEKKWILTYGFPPIPDPVPIRYESYGVELKGWIVEMDKYLLGKFKPFLHLSDESMLKLPLKMESQDFNLNYANESGENTSLTDEMIAKLKESSPSSPITVTVDKLTVMMEGTPTLRLASPPL